MTATTEVRIAVQRTEDLARLDAQAERAGVRIMPDTRAGRRVATGATDPTRRYLVSPQSGCTCLGFLAWGRCQHWALVLVELGVIGDGDDQEPATEPIREPVQTVDDRTDLAYAAD